MYREGREMIELEKRVAPGDPQDGLADEPLSPLRVLTALLRGRRTIIACTVIGLALGVTAALLRPRTYTTTFSFIPQGAQDLSKGGLASLAGQIGVSLGAAAGLSQSPQIYADLLQTREVLVPVATGRYALTPGAPVQVPLSTFLDVKGDDSALVVEKTLRKLRKEIVTSSVATRTTGVVTVTVHTESAAVSLEIAQRLLDGLNRFNLVTRQSQAGEERRFVQARLNEAREALRSAENAFVSFLQTNRQYTNSPELTLVRDRLQREVSLQQQVVASLAQNYEDARIREVRDTPVITVIESPTRAVEADPRGRAALLAGGVLGGAFVGMLLVLVLNGLRRMRLTDPGFFDLVREWRRARGVAA